VCYKGHGLDHMNLYIDVNNTGIQAGDEIGIFDGAHCVGAGKVMDVQLPFVSLVASADDPTTDEQDGFIEGNSLVLKVASQHTGMEFDLNDIEFKSGSKNRFEAMGTAFIQVKSAPAGLRDMDAPVTALGNNHPNPFTQGTTIPFSIGEDTRVKMTVYDVLGQEVVTLIDDRYKAGEYSIDWKSTNASGALVMPGIYYVKLQAAGKVFTEAIEKSGN